MQSGLHTPRLLPAPHSPPPYPDQEACYGVLEANTMKRENDGTHLPHFLAQAGEDNVTKGICRHLVDVFLWVPLLALEGVRLDGHFHVLLMGVTTLTHYLPVKIPRVVMGMKGHWCSLMGHQVHQKRVMTFISPNGDKVPLLGVKGPCGQWVRGTVALPARWHQQGAK